MVLRMHIVDRWRAFEQLLSDKKLSHTLHYAPKTLRHARSVDHPRGAQLETLLPEGYRRFVAEVGYPVLGFETYDRSTFSFLPPEPMAVVSVQLADEVDGDWRMPKPDADGITRPTLAFFAGYDLSDLHGFAFRLDSDGKEPWVWCVEDGAPVEELDSFENWLAGELDRLEAKVAAMPVGGDAESASVGDDPHRLLDYSLDRSYADAAYSAADLQLAWVEQQIGSPYSYGLIDAEGRYRIPLGKRFLSVRPFRDGVAEVILAGPGASYAGPWRRIDADGALLDEPG